MSADPVLDTLSRLTEALRLQSQLIGSQRELLQAVAQGQMEVARSQQLLAERRAEVLPPADPEDPLSAVRRAYALALSIRAYAIGLGVEFLSARFEDGAAFTWDAPDLKIAHPELGHLTLEQLRQRLEGAGG